MARRAMVAPLILAGKAPHRILEAHPGMTHDQLYRDARALGLYEQLRQSWQSAIASGYKP